VTFFGETTIFGKLPTFLEKIQAIFLQKTFVSSRFP